METQYSGNRAHAKRGRGRGNRGKRGGTGEQKAKAGRKKDPAGVVFVGDKVVIQQLAQYINSQLDATNGADNNSVRDDVRQALDALRPVFEEAKRILKGSPRNAWDMARETIGVDNNQLCKCEVNSVHALAASDLLDELKRDNIIKTLSNGVHARQVIDLLSYQFKKKGDFKSYIEDVERHFNSPLVEDVALNLCKMLQAKFPDTWCLFTMEPATYVKALRNHCKLWTLGLLKGRSKDGRKYRLLQSVKLWRNVDLILILALLPGYKIYFSSKNHHRFIQHLTPIPITNAPCFLCAS